MTGSQTNDKPAGAPAEAASPRHVYGPRSVGAVLPPIVRPAFRRRSPAAAQVLADWEAIVGPALAAATTPRKLFSGTLAIACAGPTIASQSASTCAVAGERLRKAGRTMAGSTAVMGRGP